MRITPDPRFAEEAERFVLRRHCEDCALFDAEKDACAHGFPTAEHRRAADPEAPVVFCKDFELA